jgi:hypothetical protein
MRVRVALDRQLLLQATLGRQQPLWSRPRHRLGPLGTPLLERLARRAQPTLAALARGQDRRQLVPTPLTERRGLGGIGRDRLLDDRASDLLIGHGAIAAGVGIHLGPIDRDHPDRRQPGVRTQRQHLAKQLAQRSLVALHEPRDRGVIRSLVGGDDAARDVLHAGTLDRPRRAHPPRPAIQHSAIIIAGS